MRISFVQYEALYPFHIGGPGVVTYNLLREFDKINVRVNFFIFWNGPSLRNADLGLSPNVKIHTMEYRPIPSLRALVNLLRSSDPIVHFNSMGSRPPHPLLPLLCRLLRKTVVCSVHGYTPVGTISLNKLHKWPWSWVVNAEFRLWLITADRLIVFSDYMKTLVSHHVPINRIKLIPLGVNLRAYPVQKRRRKSDEAFRIICVTRLVTVKGVETLVKAMSLMQPKVDVHTYIVGGGPLRSKLQALIDNAGLTDKVKLCGVLTGETKISYLKSSDIFVLPSIHEAIPMAILEALAVGLPVVASDVGGIPELVRPGVNGLLVKAGNPHDLAAAISKLIDDGELRKRLASNARESVHEYDWSVVAKKYLSFYQELLSN